MTRWSVNAALTPAQEKGSLSPESESAVRRAMRISFSRWLRNYGRSRFSISGSVEDKNTHFGVERIAGDPEICADANEDGEDACSACPEGK